MLFRSSKTLPLSFAQQRLWFLDKLEGPNPLYNMPAAIRLVGQLHVDVLARTLNEIVRRHDALRTSFVAVDGTAVQRIAPQLTLPLEVSDLSALLSAEREARAHWLVQAEAQTPFDLAAGPLIRCSVLRLASDEHIFLLTMHHIVSDGWSIGVLVREIATLYSAYAQGLPSPLGELPIQYPDFAHWQRQWLRGEVLERQVDYWKRRLAHSPSLLELPTDRPRPAIASLHGANVPLVLPSGLGPQLQALSAREQSTLFMTLSAAFSVLLARYSGQSDICIGTPVANRNREEIEGLIGVFVNTLVLRAQVDLNLGFTDLLAQVRQHTLDAYAHQDMPFEQLIDALQPQRHASYTPLFQVMFVLHNAPQTRLELPGMRVEVVLAESGTAKFDLTLFLTEDGDELGGNIEYNTGLFDAATIERMAGHFANLLQGIVTEPGRPVGELPMVGELERRQLLDRCNAAAPDYLQPSDSVRTAHQLFEAQVARTPDHVAVVYEGSELTYAQLNARANQLARHLRGLGVGPDTLVGLYVDRSLEMLVGLYGILKAGGAYVPLDPTYPRARLATIVADARPKAILTQRHLLESMPAQDACLFCLDSDFGTLHGYDSDNLESRTAPTDLAYVIYTSGSTGKPKGVMIEHAGLTNYLQWALRAYAPEEGEAIPVGSPLAFDATVTSLYCPLLSGRRVVLIPRGQEVEGLERLLLQPTRWSLVKISPAHLQLLGHRLLPLKPPCTVGAFVIGGEALPPSTVELWRTIWPQTRLINEYGPTETVVGCCVYDVPQDWIATSSVPIGRPISNTQMYILDDRRQPVTTGITGEIYIGGAGVARGYLNRPELTAEQFISDPFSVDPRARMYKTGDLARWRADGNIEYLGRSDHQVKIRGLRIELGEIEAQLQAAPQIRAAVVLAREDSAGDKRLVAYVVPQDVNDTPQPEGLRATLLHSLPDYMVPAHFVFLDVLPVTPNGKLDRQALPAPDMTRGTAGYVAPETDIEVVLARIWADVLKLDKVGTHDNFFALGGNSLMAVQIVSRVCAIGSMQIAVRDLFTYPSLGELAAFVGARKPPVQHPNLVPVRTAGNLRPLFLIHPIGGEVQYAFELARHLPIEQPVYGLAATGLAAGERPDSSIPAMASAYLQALRQVQASGPYQLAGWSLGGLVAYEIAHQLLAAGETVDFVGLIDSGSSPLLRAQGEPFDEAGALLHWIADQHPDIAAATSHPLREELLSLAKRRDLDAMLAVCRAQQLLPAQVDMDLVKRLLAVYRAGSQAAVSYQAPPPATRVTLFAADRKASEDPTLGWADLLGAHLEVQPIGGTHASIVRSPHVERLASAIFQIIGSRGTQADIPTILRRRQ